MLCRCNENTSYTVMREIEVRLDGWEGGQQRNDGGGCPTMSEI